MAKVSLQKLQTIKYINPITIKIGEEEVKVEQYISMNMKAEFTQEFLNDVLDSHGMSSSLREEVYFNLLLIKYYTNINLTDLMLGENAFKTYDILHLNDVFNTIKAAIPQNEYDLIYKLCYDGLHIVSQYRTSIAGMFMDMQTGNLESAKDAQEILSDLNSVADSPLLQSILTDLG